MRCRKNAFDLPVKFTPADELSLFASAAKPPILSCSSQESFDSWEFPDQSAPPAISFGTLKLENEIPPTAPPLVWSTLPVDSETGKGVSPQALQAINELTGRKKNPRNTDEAKKLLQQPNQAAAIGVLSQELANTLPLRVCRGAFYFYRAPIWRIVGDDELVQIIRASRPYEDLIFSLGNPGLKLLLRLLRTAPELACEPNDFDANHNLVNLADGVVDLETGEVFAPSAHYRFTTYVNVSRFELENAHPNGAFERIVSNAFDGDNAKRKLLLEVIGTILSPSLPKKFYVFMGDSNTGKSKVGEFIKNLVGDQCALNLEDGPLALREKFTLGEFPGKLLAFCFELQDTPLDSKTVAKIKHITGDGSLLAGEKKYGAKLQFVNTAKLLFCSNHPIRLARKLEDQAFWNRLVLVPFEHSIPESQQDPHLLEKLDEERGWIVKQALEAYRQLARRNFEFTQVDIPSQYQPNAQETSWQDHIKTFVDLACIVVPGNRVRTEELYCAYGQYCRINNITPCDKQHFSTALVSYQPTVFRHCKMEDSKCRGVEGIALVGNQPLRDSDVCID